jgi:hypothetical protein
MATYEITTPSGEAFEITAPDNASEADVMSYAQQQFSAQPQENQPTGNQALRTAEFASRGMTDAAADAVGAIPELVSSGLRYVGDKTGLTLAPEEGYYPDAIKQGIKSVGQFISPDIDNFGPNTPQNALERGAYGAGSGAVNAGAFMVPGMAASKLASGVTQGVGKAIASQPVMQMAAGAVGGGTESATGSSGAGLAASLATPTVPSLLKAAGRKAITPFASQLSSNEQNLAQQAKDIGIKLTPGQETGSSGLRTMEGAFNQMPFTGKSQGAMYGDQRIAFNRAVLEKAGINADDASPDVLNKAFKSIGAEFNDLAGKTTIIVDKKLTDDIAEVAHNYGRRLDTNVASVFKSYIDDLSALRTNLGNNPQIPGREYQTISSDIKTTARASANNAGLQKALYRLAGTLDDALERASGPELKSAWQNVRRRYKNMITIDKAMQSGTQGERAAANIPISGLRTAVKAGDKSGYSRGRGDLNDLSRVGDFLGSAVPKDSGTASNSRVQNFLMGGGIGSAGTYAAATGDVTGALISAGTALGMPKLTQSLYNTRPAQSYFRNQVAQPGQNKLSKALLAKIGAANYLGSE